MNEAALLQNYLIFGSLLVGLGLIGFLVRRNIIVMFLCAEMMLQGISLSLIAWGRYHDHWGGQMLVVFVITVAACEAGMALALVLMLARWAGDLDIAHWQDHREEVAQPYVDREIPEDLRPEEEWPSLTPAGVRPATPPEERFYRSKV